MKSVPCTAEAFAGYDAIVVQGQAADWVYLCVQDEVSEIRDAAFLVGKDTWETQDLLQARLGYAGHQMSVYGIGPAGESLVRFSVIAGDYGHVASKNGFFANSYGGGIKKFFENLAAWRDEGSMAGITLR